MGYADILGGLGASFGRAYNTCLNNIVFCRACKHSHSSLACSSTSGDTLLAIRAPIGTQLEVPIPESVSSVCAFVCFLSSFGSSYCFFFLKPGLCVLIQVLNGQRKYQIRLKSSSGPIEVLLVNKDPSSASPVVLPVPPPEDILQNLPAPTPTSLPPTAASQVHTDIRFLCAIRYIHLSRLLFCVFLYWNYFSLGFFF